MQALPQKTTDYIAEQFRAYFVRKSAPRMTLKDARDIVDYLSVSGPVSAPSGSGAIDPGKPHVTGSGGRPRPSPERIERILSKYTGDEGDALWDKVFDSLIEQYKEQNNKKALKFIKLAYEQQLKREEICEKMHISEKTSRTYRVAVLTAAAICAIIVGGTLDT